MTTAAEKSFFEFLPPKLSGEQKVGFVQANTTAQDVNVFAHLSAGDAPEKPRAQCQLYVKCTAGDAYISFKDGDSAASVTVNTGFPLANGDSATFWINAESSNYMEYVTAASTANVHFYICSPHY